MKANFTVVGVFGTLALRKPLHKDFYTHHVQYWYGILNHQDIAKIADRHLLLVAEKLQNDEIV